LADHTYFTLPAMTTLDICSLNRGRHNWQKIDTFQTPYDGGGGTRETGKEYSLRSGGPCLPKPPEQVAHGESERSGPAEVSRGSIGEVAASPTGEAQPWHGNISDGLGNFEEPRDNEASYDIKQDPKLAEREGLAHSGRPDALETVLAELQNGVVLLREDMALVVNHTVAEVRAETAAMRQDFAQALADTRAAVNEMSTQLADHLRELQHGTRLLSESASLVKEDSRERGQKEAAPNQNQEMDLIRRFEDKMESVWPALGEVQALRERQDQLQQEAKRHGDLTAVLADITQSIRADISGLDQKIQKRPTEIDIDFSQVMQAIDQRKMDVDLSPVLMAVKESNAKDIMSQLIVEVQGIKNDLLRQQGKMEEQVRPALEEHLAPIVQALSEIKGELEAGIDFSSVAQAIENCAIQVDTSALTALLQEGRSKVGLTGGSGEIHEVCTEVYKVSSDVETDFDFDLQGALGLGAESKTRASY
jgi:hypothetical protein